MKEIDNFYLQQPEPMQSCLLALRKIILAQNPAITEEWKYKLPCFCINGKMLCYLWIHKKYKQPYVGIVKGNELNYPELLIENRKQIKIMLFNPNQDLPLHKLQIIVQHAISLYSF
ncbi:MAG: DUF1801 domain-containing protein [Bacteroidia bacterium]